MRKTLFLVVIALLPLAMKAIDIKNAPVIGYIARNWSAVDSGYVSPAKYAFTVQAVQQNNEEILSMKTDDGMKVRVRSPWDANVGLGLFWSGLGYNYTFSLTHNKLMDGTKKTQMGLNIYSQLFNINLQYRKTGGDFELKQMQTARWDLLKFGDGALEFQNMKMGQDCRIKMINVDINYVWNHKKFSYPAAQSFGARQLRSAGSLITGLAFNHYNIDNTFATFQTMSSLMTDYSEKAQVDPNVPEYKVIRDAVVGDKTQDFFGGKICSSLRFTDVNLNVGYAYNLVPFEHFLLSGSVTLSPALKICKGDNHDSEAMQMFRDKSGAAITDFVNNLYTGDKTAEYQTAINDIIANLNNAYNKTEYSFSKTTFDINASVRLAATWATDRFFAGGQFVLQHYRYHTGLYTKFDNTFFTLNFTAGVMF